MDTRETLRSYILAEKIKSMRKVLRHISEDGPIERYGSNEASRLLQWVKEVRNEAAESE